ncbi:hypothetical protein ACFPAF_19040 [Hymenobacter endophyticus]|uniref:DUF4412 domain-containing protein n=1 Tax=Hymenobacter endophyticus TaxID=3076335 RepID=A0ABU3TMA6_9BACT|nr:hypothetical protein [Hymenobacter endophyticus]MDU0372504.1 hypothetical protein [Hymenobacter endophyticus]
MRFLLLVTFIGLLFQLPGRAQTSLLNSFRPGSYVLRSDRNKRLNGQMKLRSSTLLLVKDEASKTIKLTPEDVQSFQIEGNKYTVAYDFEVRQGLIDALIEQAFVEQLDSGQVVLMRYAYTIGSPATMRAGGMMTGGQSENDVYLLRWGRGTSVSAIQASWLTGGGTRFREALLPYVNQRPDLVNLIESGTITVRDLPTLVKAINTGQAYGLSTSSRN